MSDALAGWDQVCRGDEIPDGEVVAAQAGGRDVAIVRVGTELFCVDGVCSHALGFLDEGTVDGYEVECPLHGGRFDVRSGEPTHEPAELPIATHRVRVEEGMVYVHVEP